MKNNFIKPFNTNEWYYLIIIFAVVLIIISNIIIICFPPKILDISEDSDAIKWIGKFWVIISSLLIIAVTSLYWYYKKSKGKKILDIIPTDKRWFVKKIIILSLFIMFFAIGLNIYFILKDKIVYGMLSVLAIAIVFLMYCIIDKSIIKALENIDQSKNEIKSSGIDVKKELTNVTYAFKYSDGPIFITFIILTLYAVFIYPHYPQMELFLSGAVGFQLIYSVVTWANV